ncbi:hypothetical protein NPIL_263021 [Nephila pilipes]|uniref:Uncharacterized protein n=1 Tax=Nephila pilipes TaxID=299642 RepID=A0A8X6QZM9_NEPPI|nr:hypothetical protein NPIL_42001 [Nephila pilipes]GFU61167.1 hypothetical protein NPIL_263021 [Nephila pilipes]
MKFITLLDEKQNPTFSEDTSSDLGDITKKEATSSDSQKQIEASASSDVPSSESSVFHHAPERPRILRTGKRARSRKEYGQVTIITDSFETDPIVQKALAGPNN